MEKYMRGDKRSQVLGIVVLAVSVLIAALMTAHSATLEATNPKAIEYDRAVLAFKLSAEKTCTALRLAARDIPTSTPTPTVAIVPKPTATPSKK